MTTAAARQALGGSWSLARGLVFTDDASMPRAGGAIGRHVVALDTLLSEHPEPLALRDQVVWLQPPATNGE